MSDVPVDSIGDDGWQRLPRRLLVVRAIPSVAALVPIGLAFVLLGQSPGSGVLFFATVAIVANLARDLVRIVSTRVRVGADRVELRTGVLTTSHRSLRRERVRTVDVRSGPVQRIAGLAVVRIGTGEQARGEDSGDLELDALDARVARGLQHDLLPGTADAEQELLASLRWRWLPWSILSWWTLALPAIALAALVQLFNAAGLDTSVDEQDVQALADDATRIGTVMVVGIAAAAFVAFGVVARCASFVETWWSFELRRDRDSGLLRSRRGLFTTRATSLQLARIRGVQLREPVLLRPWRVGAASVITTGLADRAESAERGGSTSLGPAAPRMEVEAIAARVLDEEAPPTSVALRSHPRAARSRRLFRAGLVVVLATGAGTAAAGAWGPGWAWGLLAAPPAAAVAVLLALDLARSLGHACTGRWLVVRSGSLVRRSSALEVDGITGWIGRRTFFQRRAGLLTLYAATAAGDGAYAAIDADERDAVRLAVECTPALLAPFLQAHEA